MHPDSIHVETRAPIRIDVFLVRRLAGVSRARVQRHIAAGNVLVDGQRVRSSHRLLGGEVITLPPLTSRRLSEVAEAVDIPVVYEDDDIVVVNKPAGLVVHPVGGEYRRTVIGALHRFAGRSRFDDVVPIAAKALSERPANQRLIVNDQHLSCGHPEPFLKGHYFPKRREIPDAIGVFLSGRDERTSV